VFNILESRAQGLSIREVARRVGHDRKTARKWLRQREIPRYGPRLPVSGKLEPYKPYLQARIAVGVWNANRLLEELRAQGYSGGKTILKDFLKPLARATSAPMMGRTPKAQAV
jgi:transposase